MKSIVLLTTKPNRVNEVHNNLRQLQPVLECCTSFGRYDEAAIIWGESLEELWQILASQIRPMCGVAEVFPCLIEDDRSLMDPPQHVREFVGLCGASGCTEVLE
jgi:hypothetical protein